MTQIVLHWASLLSTLLVFISGTLVIALGDWRKFKLKYSGVILSTIGGMWLFLMGAVVFQPAYCVNFNSSCFTWAIYSLMRNIAFVLFHISVGRDAIRFKHYNRRAPNG